MITSCLKKERALRPTAILLTASLTLPTLLAGCGGNSATPPPPVGRYAWRHDDGQRPHDGP